MKYGKYLADRLRPEWREFYLDYNSLKDLIKASAQLNGQAEGTAAYSPRTTSLTVVRSNNTKEAAEEKFFMKLESEVRASSTAQRPCTRRPGARAGSGAMALRCQR